ncbi:MAG: extracellular solute-binding protein, partial [Chloroflexota bacterium]|nr:extracellular solute-binding protein [Chloroflexota bacterium]
LYQGGGSIISEDGSSIVIDSPEALAALDFYYGLYTDGLATTFTEVGAQWPGDAFAKGLASIVFEGPWLIGFMAENAPNKPYGIAEMPAGPGGQATMAFTQAYGLNAASEVQDAAFTLIGWLTGVEGMTQWSTGFGVLPSRPEVAAVYLEQFPEREPFLVGGEYARPWQLGSGGERFNTEANAELQALFAGQQDTATTLANMQARAEEIIRLG